MDIVRRFIRKYEPKFCHGCGGALEVHSRDAGYNEQTGLRTIVRYLACPRTTTDTRNEWEQRYASCTS